MHFQAGKNAKVKDRVAQRAMILQLSSSWFQSLLTEPHNFLAHSIKFLK